jgi:DNA-binding Lrp family transcriptional regulator
MLLCLAKATVMELDNVDWQLLNELDRNADQSLDKLAAKLKVTRDIIHYRIKRLEEARIIIGYTTIVNYPGLGYLTGCSTLKFRNENENITKKIFNYFGSADTFIPTVAFCTGEYDLEFRWHTKSVQSFFDFQKTFLRQYSSYIQNSCTTLISRAVLYSRDYLAFGTKERRIFYMENKAEKKIDNSAKHSFETSKTYLDENILKLLLHMPFAHSAIAKEVGVSNTQLYRRIKELEKEGIILARRAVLNLEKLGYHRYTLLLYIDFTYYDSLLGYLATLPNIISVEEQLGNAGILVCVESKDYQEFKKVEFNIKEKFNNTILYVQTYELQPLFTLSPRRHCHLSPRPPKPHVGRNSTSL